MTTPARAHYLVSDAIRTGVLTPEACETCGRPARDPGRSRQMTDAHHRFGYGEPLRVVWLCRRDHLAEHGMPLGATHRGVMASLADGLSQSAAARRFGISRQRVHQIVYRAENGQTYDQRGQA